MYQPRYQISNEILANMGLIEAAREVVENAPLVPVYESRFVKEAVARSVHHTTKLEVDGYDMTLGEVKRAIEGEKLMVRDRDLQEVINYRNILRYLDELEAKKDLQYSGEMLKRINAIAGERIVTDGRVGIWRSTQVVLKNSATGEIVFRPPSAIEVPFLLDDYFRWLNSEQGRKNHPVLRAGITHYYLVAVHPFIEANGRSARAFATLVLMSEGYDVKKFFSLEEYFDKDALHYYEALMAVDRQHTDLGQRDLTLWLEYFTQAMAVELTRVKEKVKGLSRDIKLKGRIGQQIPLNERQLKIMEYLEEQGEMTTAEARRVISGYSDDTLLRDFSYLLKKGIIKKKGSTKAARYILR
jgi:Fic family protein